MLDQLRGLESSKATFVDDRTLVVYTYCAEQHTPQTSPDCGRPAAHSLCRAGELTYNHNLIPFAWPTL
jgi:hypothetical protein